MPRLARQIKSNLIRKGYSTPTPVVSSSFVPAVTGNSVSEQALMVHSIQVAVSINHPWTTTAEHSGSCSYHRLKCSLSSWMAAVYDSELFFPTCHTSNLLPTSEWCDLGYSHPDDISCLASWPYDLVVASSSCWNHCTPLLILRVHRFSAL